MLRSLKGKANTWLVAAALCAAPLWVAAEEMRISIPDSSAMRLYGPDEFDSLVSFKGQAELTGTLVALSRSDTIDDETQWSVSLFFQPDPDEYKKLPQVRFEGEPAADSKTSVIELNFFQKDKTVDDIARIFGAKVTAQMGRKNVEAGVRGTLTLEAYRTGVECDRRYRYARLVSFQTQKALPQASTRQLVQGLGATCM